MSPAQQKSEAAPAKLAIVQSLLDALMGDAATDTTVILSNTHGLSKAGPNNPDAEAAGRIPSLVLAGRSLEALALCHTALRAADRRVSPGALKPMIAELRKVLERELLTPQDIDLVSPVRRTHLLPRRSVLIGRPSAEKAIDIAVNCRWFSRGDRNLSLFCDGAGWFVEDIGSTNGHRIDGRPLKPGHPLALPVGETRIAVGAARDKPALATIHLHRPAKDPGAVVVTLSGVAARVSAEADPWPSMEQDTKRRWVVFREQIGVSAGQDCALALEEGPAGILAAIRYQNGFWIVPASRSTIALDDIAFGESVPLPAGAAMSLSGTKLRVEIPDSPIAAAPDAAQALAG